jgi:hypothetical protein
VTSKVHSTYCDFSDDNVRGRAAKFSCVVYHSHSISGCVIPLGELQRQFMEVQGAEEVEMRKQIFVIFGNWTRRHLVRVRVGSALGSVFPR